MFQARVIIWDFENMTMLKQHEHHKVRVEAVVFSKDERYLISLGKLPEMFCVYFTFTSIQLTSDSFIQTRR